MKTSAMSAVRPVLVVPRYRPIEVLATEINQIKVFRRQMAGVLKTTDEQLAELLAELREAEAMRFPDRRGVLN